MLVRTAVIRSALERGGQVAQVRGALPEVVSAISDDSRQVQPGGVFVAVRGVERDGHDYLDAAVRAGASVVIVEEGSDVTAAVPRIVVREGRRAAAVAAAAFYGDPSKGMKLIGVTGTNGKTTTVGILRHLLDRDPGDSASIGTLGVLVGSQGVQVAGGGSLTTPGPIELQRVLRGIANTGARTVTMEVSSHSLHQHRVDGIRFAVAVFTNLTRDHLDYHGTMESYVAAKLSLLEHLAPGGAVVYNADDPAWSAVGTPANRRSFGIQSANADVTARDVQFAQRGSNWTLSASGGSHPVRLPLIGEFNVANALAAAAAAQAAGLALETIAHRLSTVPQVPGRLEILAEHPTILRDYAHTPDALERALTALRPFTPGALIVVFGAGGDRDRGKRPLMAQIADRFADKIVVTSDNPRTEHPERIIDEIVAPLAAGRYERIEDRRAAIARAIAMADPARDVVLLAGKGHETYQVRGTAKLPFDEREIVGTLLRKRTRAARAT